MADDVLLERKWSSDEEWFKFSDPRPPKARVATGSRTVQDLWTYGADEELTIRFEVEPIRGWAFWYAEERIGFLAEMIPEPVPGASINTAKRMAVAWLDRSKPAVSR